VLNPLGRRSRKPIERYRERLSTLRDQSGPAAIEALVNLQDSFAVTAIGIALMLNAPPAETTAALADDRFVKLSLGDEEGYTTRSKWADLKSFAVAALKAHHESQPLSAGLEMEALREHLPYEVAARNFRALIDRLSRESEIVREESLLRLRAHQVKLGGADSRLGAQLAAKLAEAGFQPPDLKQLAGELNLPPAEAARLRTLLGALEREGRVVKIATDLYFDRARLDELACSSISSISPRSAPRSIVICSAPRASSRSHCWIFSTIAALPPGLAICAGCARPADGSPHGVPESSPWQSTRTATPAVTS